MAITDFLGPDWQTCTCDGACTAGCLIHEAAASDENADNVYEYACLILKPDTTLEIQTLSCVSTSHAFEEAGYECEGKCLAVKRGAYLHAN